MDILSKRIKMFRFFQRNLNKKNTLCVKNSVIDKIRLMYRIGRDSNNGEILFSCYPENNCKYDLAIKKIPLKEKDKSFSENIFSKEALTGSTVWSELFFHNLLNNIVLKNICPHLPLLYGYYICNNNCDFENKRVLYYYRGVKSCVITVNELAQGDLEKFFRLPDITHLDIMIAYFQIFMGLYCIKKFYKIRHHDLHSGNVLYHKVKPGGVWLYKVEDKKFYIPNIGYLFILWDFGYARIPELIEPMSLTSLYKKEDDPKEDFYRVSLMVAKNGIKGDKDIIYLLDNIISKSNNYPSILSRVYETIIKLNKGEVKKNVKKTFDTNKNLK